MKHTTLSSGDREVRTAQRATYAAFIATGFGFASWLARLPQVRDRLHLQPAQLGLVLLTGACGSVIALLLAGSTINRIGTRHATAAAAVLSGAGLATVGVGYRFGVVPLLIGLVVFGFGQGLWDVAMNVQGAAVEQRLGRAILPRFHASYSVGTISGGLIGAVMVALRVPVSVHLAIIGAIVAIAVPCAVRGFLPTRPAAAAVTRSPLQTWREPRTLLIGVFVLAFAFAEGTGNDWINIALVDDYRTSSVTGSFGLVLFLTAMTAGRWFGVRLINDYGRVRGIRVLSAVSLTGVALFVADLSAPIAMIGVLLWGVGASLGFPVGLSAAADDPGRAAARVGVASSIGYIAFLAGPSLIGFLGSHLTVMRAITAVAVLLAVAALVADSISPLSVEVDQVPETPGSHRARSL